MSGSVESELADPETTAARLAEIAAVRPDLADQIARHPRAYPELVAWAEQTVALRVPVVTEALADAPSVEGTFVEPTRRLTPNGYTVRYGIGLALILLIFFEVSGSSNFWVLQQIQDFGELVFGYSWDISEILISALVGIVVVVGFLVLPGRLVRRIVSGVVLGVAAVLVYHSGDFFWRLLYGWY